MKKSKNFLLLFFLVLLPIVILSGCKNKTEEYSVKLSSPSEYLEKIDFLITDKNSVSSIKDEEQGLRIYKKDEDVYLKLRVNDSNRFNYFIDEELLNNHVAASSVAWVNASVEEKAEIQKNIEEKVQQLLDEGLTEKQALEEMQKDEQYKKYAPLQIQWEKISKHEYIGNVKLTKDIIFEINKDIVVKDVWHIYTISDSFFHIYKFADGQKETHYKDTTALIDITEFDIDDTVFNVLLKEKEEQIDAPELDKIYYVYLSAPPTGLSKDVIINSENVFESELTYYLDAQTQEYYYESGFINFPESVNEQLFTSEYRYIAIFIAKKI